MNYGKLLNEPFSEYLNTDCVSAHRLNDVLPRPRVYYVKYLCGEVSKTDSPAFKFGRLFHCLALEGQAEVEKRFVIAPDVDRRTKDGKAAWAAFCEQSAGKDIVTAEDKELAWKMVESIRCKKSAVDLLTKGNSEVTFRHQLPSFSVQARVDWYNEDHAAGPMCINLKSVETLEEFDKHYVNYHYYRSDAFYRMVVAKVLGRSPREIQMVNLVSEKQAPFEVSVRNPDTEALDIGSREVLERLGALTECYQNNSWPGEPEEARTISLPAWKTAYAE